MEKIVVWLSDEAKGARAIFGYILMAALIDSALIYTVNAVIMNWGLVPQPDYDPNPQSPFRFYNAIMFVDILLRAPLFEETIFRLVPLSITVFFTKRPAILFTVVVAFAALFGAIHPYNVYGKIDVAIAGLVFGLVYLKCGGVQNHPLKAWLCAMAAHSMANLFVLGTEYYDYLSRVM